MDMAVVITQRLLLPTLPHLRPAKCRYSAGRRLTTSEECQGWHQAGLARVQPEIINTNTLEEKIVLIRLLCNHTNLNSRRLSTVMCYFGQASCGAVLLFGKINEHLFFDVSNSISRLVSGAPAQ